MAIFDDMQLVDTQKPSKHSASHGKNCHQNSGNNSGQKQPYLPGPSVPCTSEGYILDLDIKLHKCQTT